MLKSFKKYTFGSLIVATASGQAADYIQGHLGALSNQAFQQVGNVPGNRYNADFEFDYNSSKNDAHRSPLESRFHFATLVNDQNLAMYSLQEAYIGGKLTSQDSIRFGRQVLDWSEVDTAWGFGKLNNRRNFDYFRPGQEGLIGLNYEHLSSNGMKYKAFVSGLYVPESNPSLDINKKDRSITSRHAWSDAPATSADVEGIPMAIKYDVDYPQIHEIIYRYSGGVNVGYESDHWVVDNFFIRKPENNITPNVEINVDFVNRVVNASIDPRVYYHDVYGSSLKYKNQDIQMYVSGIAVRPNEFPDVDRQVRYTEIKIKKRREDYIGGGISQSNDLYTLAFNYVARLSPYDRMNDDLSPDPRWNQAINLFGLRNFGTQYSVSADVKFDMLTIDRLIMVRGNYNVAKEFQLTAGFNMIGTPGNGKSFWSPYTNNDSIYGGLRYVF